MEAELLESIQKTSSAFRQLCRPLYDLFDITYVQWIEVKNDQCAILASHPRFFEHYLEKRYYLTDPHIVNPSQMTSGLAFWSSYPSPTFLGSYVHNAREYFNVDFGVTFVMKDDPATYQAFCLASYPSNIQFKSTLLNVSETLRRLLIYLGKQIKEQFIDTQQVSYSRFLPSLKGENYETQHGMVSCIGSEEDKATFSTAFWKSLEEGGSHDRIG